MSTRTVIHFKVELGYIAAERRNDRGEQREWGNSWFRLKTEQYVPGSTLSAPAQAWPMLRQESLRTGGPSFLARLLSLQAKARPGCRCCLALRARLRSRTTQGAFSMRSLVLWKHSQVKYLHRNVIIMINAFLPRLWPFFWHNPFFFETIKPLLMMMGVWSCSLTDVSRRWKCCTSCKVKSTRSWPSVCLPE